MQLYVKHVVFFVFNKFIVGTKAALKTASIPREQSPPALHVSAVLLYRARHFKHRRVCGFFSHLGNFSVEDFFPPSKSDPFSFPCLNFDYQSQLRSNVVMDFRLYIRHWSLVFGVFLRQQRRVWWFLLGESFSCFEEMMWTSHTISVCTIIGWYATLANSECVAVNPKQRIFSSDFFRKGQRLK